MASSGAVSHKLNFGLAGIWTQQRNAYDFDLASYNSNIYDPANVPAPRPDGPASFPGGQLNDPGITGKTFVRSAAVSDTLGFLDDRLLLTAGLRRQQIVVQSYDYNTGSRNYPSYDKSITTPVYGLVLKPWEHVSFYANHIEGNSTSSVNRLPACACSAV
jgi:iron complex outermembrane receptor protein